VALRRVTLALVRAETTAAHCALQADDRRDIPARYPYERVASNELGLRFNQLVMLNRAATVVQVIQAVLQFVPLYLLFTDPGRHWFRRPAGD
jgi:hypothetical protein